MLTVVIIVLLFLSSFALTGVVRRYALKKAILDIPNARSSHTLPTPRGGGLAIAAVWFAGVLWLGCSNRIDRQLFFALLCGLPLALTGWLDDLLNLPSRLRFLVQLVCSVAALWLLGGLKIIDGGFAEGTMLWLNTFLAVIAILWSVNLFNFLDGIDGYLSTEVIFISLALFLFTGNLILLILVAAIAGFLMWNWPKAKIFMGDVGSTLLGFTVAIFAIYFQNTRQVSIPVILILTAVFWMDATITLLRRLRNREKLHEAHRKHAYQRIVQAGFSHRKTVLWALGLNMSGLVLAWGALKRPEFSLLLLSVHLVWLFFILKRVDQKKNFE
jgi:Fuc2NAc and GlcNAc transferase